MDKKVCVFCGKPPSAKTKEHVIPKWLIELTGSPKRQIQCNFDGSKLISFDQFTFPACKECNEEYSALESSVKLIVLKLLNIKPISPNEISLLLDWFDKVRVGLWLAYRYLYKDKCGIAPRFFIKQRIAQTDRMLGFYFIKGAPQGINFTGASTLLFQFTPSCFILRINELYIQNVVNPFLFSHRLGYPVLADQKYSGLTSTEMEFNLKAPRATPKYPVLPFMQIRPTFSLFQPVINKDLCSVLSEKYTPSEKSRLFMNWDNGLGQIFVEDETIRILQSDYNLEKLRDKIGDFDDPIEHRIIKQNFLIHMRLHELAFKKIQCESQEEKEILKTNLRLVKIEQQGILREIEKQISASQW